MKEKDIKNNSDFDLFLKNNFFVPDGTNIITDNEVLLCAVCGGQWVYHKNKSFCCSLPVFCFNKETFCYVKKNKNLKFRCIENRNGKLYEISFEFNIKSISHKKWSGDLTMLRIEAFYD